MATIEELIGKTLLPKVDVGGQIRPEEIMPGMPWPSGVLPVQMTGDTYVGDGTNGRSVNTGFKPDLVIIQTWRDVNNVAILGRGAEDRWGLGTGGLSFYDEGFTLISGSAESRINVANQKYQWIAFKWITY